MNAPLLAVFAALGLAQLLLPRRLAFLPLLIAACHVPYRAAFGGDLTAVRLVLLIGLGRAITCGAFRWQTRNPLDLLLVVWSVVALLSSIGHTGSDPFQARLGLVFNVFGTYLYARAFVLDAADFWRLARCLAVVLLPLAALMAVEALSGKNPYAVFGTMNVESLVREGRIRAQGPFGTPILSGTLGATCVPLLIALWRCWRYGAMVGLGACLVIVFSSASSGPISTLLLGVFAIVLWRCRRSLTEIKVAVVITLIVLHFVKERPIWYLIALVDFVGGSTGWHRARLIDAAIQHLNEWWLSGTDVTSHWMPYVLTTTPGHCDITSYYVYLGVVGGLPLLLCLLVVMVTAWRRLGRRLRQLRSQREYTQEFSLWCVGSVLFAHAATFLTISYFDQLSVFFWTLIATVTPLAISVPVERPAPAAYPHPAPATSLRDQTVPIHPR